MSIVTFRPIGRLGNNMFQTAAAIAYAKKYGYEWRVPVNRYPGDVDPWLLTNFWPNLPTTDRRWIGDRYEQHDPKDFNYNPIPNIGPCTLVGFFQSEKFFEGAQDEVRAAFPLKHYPEYEGYVSIHVRRGDYVTNANSFPPLTKEFITNAMVFFYENLKRGYKLVWFSDDIKWCIDSFKSIYKSDIYLDEPNEYIALSKMASCSHHIIANSTFSWWGAWLGHNPDRIVVSPSYDQWFGPSWTGKPPKDIIPERWKQIRI